MTRLALALGLLLVGVFPTRAAATGDCVVGAASEEAGYTGAFIEGGVTVAWLALDQAGLESVRGRLKERCPGAEIQLRTAAYPRTRLQGWLDSADVLAIEGVTFAGVGDREARIVVAVTEPEASALVRERFLASGVPLDAFMTIDSGPVRQDGDLSGSSPVRSLGVMTGLLVVTVALVVIALAGIARRVTRPTQQSRASKAAATDQMRSTADV